MKISLITLAASLLMPFTTIHAAEVANLRCEYLKDPLGIDVAKPRLSWKLETGSTFAKATADKNLSTEVGSASGGKPERGIKQTAYQILVASKPELIAKNQGDLWDSGKVESDQSIQVEYAGKPLESRMECYWKVRVWTSSSLTPDPRPLTPSSWSKPALWTMGLLKPEGWTAKWVKPGVATNETSGLNGCSWIWSSLSGDFRQTPPGPAYFRAHVNVPAGSMVKRASVVMSADNVFVLFVNGKEALTGNDYKKPQTAEITGLLKAGDNTLAVVATNAGDAPSPAGLIGRVTVELVDGRQITLETGPAWKTHAAEQPSWQKVGFADASWAAARIIAKHGDPQAWGVLPGQQPQLPQHPWLRRNFEITSEVKDAVVYVNTPGHYELYLNGQKAGNNVLAPAHASLKKRFLYNAYDVTGLLRKGKNCIALWMGPGWYQPHYGNPHGAPIVRAQLETLGAEGRTVIGTDAEWRGAESCISQIGAWTWNNMGGERWDDAKYIKDWNQVAFDDSAWANAVEIPAPFVENSWQAQPGSKMGAPISPAKIYQHNDKWVVDFGTTLTGWMRLRMSDLKPGQQVSIVYADSDNPALQFAGTPDGFQSFSQEDAFIAGPSGEGEFCSKFNQHAFRYAVIAGLTKAPEPTDVEAMMVGTDLEQAGDFKCSHDLFNRIHQVTVRTYLTQTPCGVLGGGEAREKLGYGDGGSFLTGFLYNLQSDAFYKKWLRDWCDGQAGTGFLGHTAPEFYPAGGGPSWGGQASELTRRLDLYFGDRRAIETAYPVLKKYVDHLESNTDNDILRYFNPYNPGQYLQWYFLGDWNPPGASGDKHRFTFETPEQREFFNNCYRILLWQDLANFARRTGDAAEQKRCEDRLAVLRPLIHKTFFDPEKNTYRVNRQAYLVIALRARIMPEELRPVILKQLEDNIVVEKKGHLDCGMQGSYMLLDLLAQENRPDLAALIMGQETFPGWGFLLKERKVTTWPESWTGWGSQIIQVVATPGAWFYEGLAGIRPDPAQPGFKHFSIRPGIVDSVDWVECHYDSPYGRIVSNWKREGDPSTGLRAGKLTMDVTVPPNSTATVYVQTKDAAGVTESGKPVAQAEGVKFLRMENSATVYAVGSGTYQFQSALAKTAK